MKQNYIASTFFSKNVDVQRGVAITDYYSYIKDWYFSIVALNLKCIVFHDNLDESFIESFFKDNIQFIKVEQKSLNTVDYRWVIYKEFLNNTQEEINSIIFTDISDVVFLKNPFEFIDTKPDTILIGTEECNLTNCWLTERNGYFYDIIKDFKEYEINNAALQLNNCGIVGGNFDIMKSFVNDVADILLLGNVEKDTVDMSVTNYLIHTKYKDKFFCGHPFNTRFRHDEVNSECYVKHK
jgi:hypothetical protein